jgi:alkanesulfonate monooxygenase SsuD/methylene tetrahydromethanopterin reductase-like flavin-dependent oxidoreductase (luciferase family)
MVVVGAGGQWPGVINVGYGKRVTGCGEAVAMVRRAVAGEVVNWKGEVYSARYFRSTWVRKGAPPIIYAGATGEKMLAMATRLADGTMMSDMTLPQWPRAAGYIRAGLAAAGRDAKSFRVNNFCAFHVKEDKEASFREARRELMVRGWLGQEWLEAFLTPPEVEIVNARRDAFLTAFRNRSGEIKGVPPDIVAKLVEGLSLAGDLSDVDRHIERMKEFEAGGMTENALRVHDDPADAIRIIGERIVPRMR